MEAARSDADAAGKALATAMKREPREQELGLAEHSPRVRQGHAQQRQAELREQGQQAEIAALKAKLHADIDGYIRDADQNAHRFCDILALDGHLSALGAPQNIRTADTMNACFPGFAGHPSSITNTADLLRDAQRRAIQQYGHLLN